MSNVIDILVIIDAQSIMRDFNIINSSPDAPTVIPGSDKYIYMLTRPEYVKQGQGSSHLYINAKNGDVIRWRGVSLSKDSEYSAALLNLHSVLSNDASTFFAAPVVKPLHSYIPVLKSDNPVVNPDLLDVDIQPTVNYYWETSVKQMPPPGGAVTEHYTFKVGIYDNGVLKGYVTWDPGIVLSNN
ncbi:inclusion body family protein [Xenorhabdus nematophila]|uniref:inclusion body family protein n=1 Tax=Xenorhabdus nematophila TaxID=628 RepID=UPI00032756B1|nr:inclusion body family protein [Xenorhabdus nematophila]CCW32634.1 conserved hypothetical protein [Xenorhabdus nematophila F1]